MRILLAPRITAPFGSVDSVHQTQHTGVDVALPIGHDLYAPEPGIVSRIADYGDFSLGKAVFVKTTHGYQYILGHLNDVQVSLGDRVSTGDLFAHAGNTGFSTGPHVHIAEVTFYGKYLDPSGLVDKVVKKTAQGLMESVQHKIHDIILGTLAGLRDVVVDLSYSIALVGGGLGIILHAAGYKDGRRWAGILTTAFVLIKYLLG